MPTRRRTRLALVAAVGLAGAGAAGMADGDGRAGSLVLLAAGVVLGEMLVLRLERGSGVPLSYAVMLVLAASFSFVMVMAAVVPAEIIAFFVVPEPRSRRLRVSKVAFRALAASGAVGAHRGVGLMMAGEDTLAKLLVSLVAACAALLAVHELSQVLEGRRSSFGGPGRTAWLAIASSGMLMAIGYRGVDGGANVGTWGPVLFSIPLLGAWYAFDRLESASRTHRQTIVALSLAPELGGLVRVGHAARVATTALAIGRELGLGEAELEHLETAALLHHLGEVILEEPEHSGALNTSGDVAAVTGAMLREIAPLAPAGSIVAGESPPRDDAGTGIAPGYRLASQVLKVASAFDDLAGGDEACSRPAIEALYSGPGYAYDNRVLEALEVVLQADLLAST